MVLTSRRRPSTRRQRRALRPNPTGIGGQTFLGTRPRSSWTRTSDSLLFHRSLLAVYTLENVLLGTWNSLPPARCSLSRVLCDLAGRDYQGYKHREHRVGEVPVYGQIGIHYSRIQIMENTSRARRCQGAGKVRDTEFPLCDYLSLNPCTLSLIVAPRGESSPTGIAGDTNPSRRIAHLWTMSRGSSGGFKIEARGSEARKRTFRCAAQAESTENEDIDPPGEPRRHPLNSATSSRKDAFASPNSIRVFSLKKRGFSIPANPAAIDRFRTMTVLASSTLMMGMP